MPRNARKKSAENTTNLDFRKMSGEARVSLAAEMSSTAAAITLGSIMDQNPGVSRAKLLELARRRFYSGRRVR